MIYTPSQPHSNSHSPQPLPAHTPSPSHPSMHTLPPLHNLTSPHMSMHSSSLHSSGAAALPQIREPTASPATPGLIHRHEEGYASLPPSPLDLTFPPNVQQHTTLPSLTSLQNVPPLSSGGMCGGAGYAGYADHAAVYDGSMGYSVSYSRGVIMSMC